MGLLPQLGMLEVILLAAVTLVVVGPKELPRFLKGVGQFVAQLQSMAMEFKGTMNEMIRESELDEIRREIDDLVSVDPAAELDEAMREFEAMSKDVDLEMEKAIEGPVARAPVAPRPTGLASEGATPEETAPVNPSAGDPASRDWTPGNGPFGSGISGNGDPGGLADEEPGAESPAHQGRSKR